MVCSDERTSNKFPFDIQHRRVVTYKTESPSDFASLRETLTKTFEALLAQPETIQRFTDSTPLADEGGLTQPEIIVLGVVANNAFLPGSEVPAYSVRNDAERAGSTVLGFNLGVRRLINRGYLEEFEISDPHQEENYPGLRITEKGWQWIETNDSRFLLEAKKEIPF
jgi:hypothetical protein